MRCARRATRGGGGCLLKIVELKNINPGAPSQWQGLDARGLPVYVRYGEGYLSVSVGEKGDSVFSAVFGDRVFGEQVGEKSSGEMSFERLKECTAGFLEWPGQES